MKYRDAIFKGVLGGLIVALGMTIVVSAAPTAIYQRSILPTVDSVYDIGTTSLRYNGYFNTLIVDGGCTGCSDPFPFDPVTHFGLNMNSTSTPIWGTQGLYASSTSRFQDLTLQVLALTPEGSQVVTSSASTLMISGYSHYHISTTTDVVLASTPTIPDGDYDGHLLIITNTSTAATIDLQDESALTGSNIKINGASGTIKPGSAMTLLWDDSGSAWYVISNPTSNVAGANASTIAVRNTSGSAIAAGKAVYATGFNTGLNRITVDLADADDPSKMPAIGITATSINNNANGDIIAYGNAINIVNTLGTSVNQGVWVDTTAGGLTFTRPSLDAVQRIGLVTKVAAAGSILIQGAGRSNDVPYTMGSYAQPLLNIYASSTSYLDFVSSTRLESATGLIGGIDISNDGTKSTLLALAGDYFRIGDAGVTSHSLAANDDLLVSGKLEVDGASYFDSDIALFDDDNILMGDLSDGKLSFNASQTPDTLVWGIGSEVGGAGNGNSLLLVGTADVGYDFAHARQLNPTLFIHSASQSQTEWVSLAHNALDAELFLGQGNLVVSSTALVIPTSTNPVIGRAGAMAVNVTTSSLRFHDNTAERALYDTIEKTITIATSTLDAFEGQTASSTIALGFGSVNTETWTKAVCATTNGTAEVEFGDGTNFMEYIKLTTTPSVTTLATNNSFNNAELRYIRTGQVSSTGVITCTVTVRRNAD